MHTFKSLLVVATLALGGTVPLGALAQTQHEGPGDLTAPMDASMTHGEVRKVDAQAGKITIKHEEIKHIQMPPMTMVFTALDRTLLSKVKTGDKVRFIAVKEGSKLVITHLVLIP